MSTFTANQVFAPPSLPPYLKKIQNLNAIVGVPSDEELIGILSVVRAAQKAAEIPGMGDSVLISRLSDHLFDVQMARYQSKYLATISPENMTYTPPTLPAHISIRLEPVTGVPSEEEVIKVQDAIRSYQQFSNAPLIFDPRVNMELSEHLFNIQMGKESHASSIPYEIPRTNLTETVERVTNVTEEPSPSTNNIGTGADVVDSGRAVQDTGTRDAIERSNRLAEQANQLAERANLLLERSNQIAERSNRLMEQARQPVDQLNKSAEHFHGLFERLDKHLEQSNDIAKGSVKPVEKLGDVLRNINRVLVRIQHAIIRYTFGNILKNTGPEFSVVINGVSRNSALADSWLGKFLYFYGIGSGLCEDLFSAQLMEGKEDAARERLSDYLSSCLG
ncbi:unnamed protein product [Rhizoctonia solani]|uniref:Laminin domain protein n=1 Tax=Rhizoctonia solani TaxID=456999 RepID=A0A8H3AIB5_9AGAM|nr:unnamed protein product [Rhizoctonia solani]